MHARRDLSKQRWLRLICLLLALLAWMPATGSWAQSGPRDRVSVQEPVICKDQRYALCAGSRCFVFDNVAYCTCDIKKGDSISSPFTYKKGDVCSLNAEGVANGFMISTFSLPKPIVAPKGKKAIYKCPRTSRADYAKCDGGICFTSTRGKSSLGFDKPIGENQIVCSCPVEKAEPEQGLQIIGPYPCRREFFKNCDADFATSDNGARLFDGSPLGSTENAIRLLTGSVPPLNTCR